MDLSTRERRLAAARTMFDAAVSGCNTHGPLGGEILYLWGPEEPARVHTILLPSCRVPASRPQALQALAKAHNATFAFFIAEVHVAWREVLDEGPVLRLGEEASDPRTGLMGLLMTGEGDATYIALREGDGVIRDIDLRGELVGTPCHLSGTLHNLLRVGTVDPTFN
jgi:hypothetical protein